MQTKIFQSGNSKAVRIPASIQVIGPEVEIIDLGKDGILLKELEQPVDPWVRFDEGISELGGSWPDRNQESDSKRADW